MIGCLILTSQIVVGQNYDDEEYIFGQQYETPLTIDLDNLGDLEELIETRKKKPKKNVFYGKKTRKGWTKSGIGKNVTIEQFRYLKEYEDPVPYVRDVYTYDFKKRKVQKTRNFKRENVGVLHGPYTKMKGTQVIEEGIYYYGVKHGRWSKWNKRNILIGKEKYYKGWPKLSMVAYYNREERQLKEIIPVHFGEKEGYYYAFHKNGNIAAMGEYRFDQKVGIWREFYDTRNKRKREIVYSTEPFDDEFIPYIRYEWNEQGKVIYDGKKRKSRS